MRHSAPGSFRDPNGSFWLVVVMALTVFMMWKLYDIGLVELW